MRLKNLCTALVIFICQSLAEAQTSTSGYWLGIMPSYQLNEEQSFTLQAEARRQGGNAFTLVRPSYHYQVKNWINLGLGVDLFTTEKTEMRYWPEFNLRSPSKILNQRLHFRFRQELRQLSGVESSDARSRIMVMSQFDLYRPYGFEIFVFDEVFYTQRSFLGEKNFFDRNWLGFRIRKNHGSVFYDLGGFWETVFSSSDTEGFVGIFSVGCLLR